MSRAIQSPERGVGNLLRRQQNNNPRVHNHHAVKWLTITPTMAIVLYCLDQITPTEDRANNILLFSDVTKTDNERDRNERQKKSWPCSNCLWGASWVSIPFIHSFIPPFLLFSYLSLFHYFFHVAPLIQCVHFFPLMSASARGQRK